MQPSEIEILREVETLRDIRRRSTAGGPGSLILDPDLPTAAPQLSPTSSGYWTPSATDDSSSSSHEDGSESGLSDVADDPSHLFWVPARLHPEIAPAEFRAFLKEHARGPADGAAVAGVSRSSSVSSLGGGLGRKKSMLSRQYKPSANDGIEEETVLPIRRNRTSVFSNPAPQLTINDLQKLEELAEEASQSDDPSRLRNVLRRSLSLNVSPSALGQFEDSADMGDEADSPIIVPRPGQILRRAARTRKAGTVDGPHRFTSNRARRASTARSKSDHRMSSDRSSSDHGDQEVPRRQSGDSDVPEVPPLPRPESYSEEASIYDAYASPELDDVEPVPVMTSNEPDLLAEFLPPQVLPHQETPQHDYGSPVVPPALHHPQPKRVLSPPVPEVISAPLHRSPSPEIPSTSASPVHPVPPLPTLRPSLHEASVYQSSTSPSPSEQHRRDKDKDKKGLFGKWGADKGGKKGHKDKIAEKEKDPGFFGSLFGTKKKQEEISAPSMGLGGSGRETAAALLGASKSSKSRAPSPSPTPVNGYSRYPIHVERAIYRLSHIKLANPRRPLYEQVLISNLMFWYLGVINNKATSPSSPSAGPQTPTSSTVPNGAPAEREQQAQAERERKEREEQEKAERERQERERERQQAEQKKESRRGSLTKNTGQGNGARRAEMPVRGPQYDMQHRAMEQEYGGYAQAGQSRSPSAPPTATGYPHPHQGRTPSGQHASQQPSAYSSVQLVQPQPQRYHDNASVTQQGQSYLMSYSTSSLPPGAMPPVNVEQGGWLAQPVGQQQAITRPHTSPSPPPRTMSTSPPSNTSSSTSPRRARSPPPQPRYTAAQEKQPPHPYGGGGRLPGRSLSATAAAPPVPSLPQQQNGKLRKGQSAHAVTPPHQRRTSEEEDLPLAYYQQQRRK